MHDDNRPGFGSCAHLRTESRIANGPFLNRHEEFTAFAMVSRTFDHSPTIINPVSS